MAFGLAIRAPWKGRVGLIGMPIVSTLIAANTLTIFVLSIFNASAVELDISNDVTWDRAHLGLFWCTIPFILGIATVSEIFCLWTDRLAPIWVLVSSSTAICIWICEMVLWQFCIPSESASVPGYCPRIQLPFFNWYKASVSAPMAAIPTLIILYIVQLSFAAVVVNRQRRYTFRSSDMSIPWERKSFDDSEVTMKQATRTRRTMSVAEQEAMLYNSPPHSARSVSVSDRSSSSSWPSFSRFSGTWR